MGQAHLQPAAIEEVGALEDWRQVMAQSADLYDTLMSRGLKDAAPYAVLAPWAT